jgi:diguanylate cyclase (GGDEF)-like protein
MSPLLNAILSGPNGWIAPLILLTAGLLAADLVLRSRQASAIVGAVALTIWALYCWLTYGEELAIWTSAFAYLALLAGWKILDARRREATVRAAPAIDELNRPPLSQKLRTHSDIAIDSSQIGRWYWDLEDQKLEFSDVWLEIARIDPADSMTDPQSWYELIHPCDLGAFRDAVSAHLYGSKPMLECEYRMRCGDAGYRWMLMRGRAGRNADGRPVWMTGIQADVTGLIDQEQRSNDQQTDRLTGLLDRRALVLRLERACANAMHNPGSIAVLALDVDRFKLVNDSLGLAVGDDALAAVGRRLKMTCGDGAACSRLGGDEFAVVLEPVKDPQQAMELAKRIHTEMRRPFRVGPHEIQLSASVGVALHGQAGVSPEELLRNAELALHRAKAQGRRFSAFDDELRARAVRTYALRNELTRAAERAEFELYYQPIYRLSDGELVEAEALLRWQRSSGETVSAAEFISLAEETGLISELGEWVMRSACVARKAWLAAGHDDFRVAVNVSAMEFLRDGFADQVQRVLSRTGTPPHLIEVELTESVLIENFNVAHDVLSALSSMGVRLSVDDFGTGYSSLSYVTRFPFSTIKLDRSLLVDITTDPRARAVAQGLISLAHSLKMEIIAEGVETVGQLHWLLAQRCDLAQGFALGKPMPAWKFSEGLRSGELKRYQPIAGNIIAAGAGLQ